MNLRTFASIAQFLESFDVEDGEQLLHPVQGWESCVEARCRPTVCVRRTSSRPVVIQGSKRSLCLQSLKSPGRPCRTNSRSCEIRLVVRGPLDPGYCAISLDCKAFWNDVVDDKSRGPNYVGA